MMKVVLSKFCSTAGSRATLLLHSLSNTTKTSSGSLQLQESLSISGLSPNPHHHRRHPPPTVKNDSYFDVLFFVASSTPRGMTNPSIVSKLRWWSCVRSLLFFVALRLLRRSTFRTSSLHFVFCLPLCRRLSNLLQQAPPTAFLLFLFFTEHQHTQKSKIFSSSKAHFTAFRSPLPHNFI